MPLDEQNGIKDIFNGVFSDSKALNKNAKGLRNLPIETKQLSEELFSEDLTQSTLRCKVLAEKLKSLNTNWDIDQLRSIENRNCTGEEINKRETYDVLEDPYQSPVVSPKKKAYIEQFEYGHSERKQFEFISDVNKLIAEK